MEVSFLRTRMNEMQLRMTFIHTALRNVLVDLEEGEVEGAISAIKNMLGEDQPDQTGL
jgi:hypothetical protein